MSQTFYIADADSAVRFYPELQRRFLDEWPEIQDLDSEGQEVPKPVVALTSSATLAGGLAFAAARAPLGDESAVWINAVLVEPRYRRLGIGTRLIAAAQESAARFGISHLYALTELPSLYSQLGWSILSSSAADFVMSWDADATGLDVRNKS